MNTTRMASLSPIVFCAIACIGTAHADQRLDAIGGHGGGPFESRCPAGQMLAGVEIRAADDVDAIRPLCVSDLGGGGTSAASPSDWHGGGGGSSIFVTCPARIAPIVGGMYVDFEGVDTVIVNSIHLYCTTAAASAAPRPYLEASFSGPSYYNGNFGAKFAERGVSTQTCPAGQVAVGVHGRSGIWLDAVGLVCAAPTEAITGIGRKKDLPASTTVPGQTICDRAKDARARNSPAAVNLEAQCRANGGH